MAWLIPQGEPFVCDARSVLSVREPDTMATCLREAAFSLRSHFGEGGTAKAGNAAGDFFNIPGLDFGE